MEKYCYNTAMMAFEALKNVKEMEIKMLENEINSNIRYFEEQKRYETHVCGSTIRQGGDARRNKEQLSKKLSELDQRISYNHNRLKQEYRFFEEWKNSNKPKHKL